MSLATNQIGSFFFTALLGHPVPPRELVAENDRPGTTGTEFILVGMKGERFSLISHADCDSFDAAKSKLQQYQALTGQGAQELVQGGVSSTNKKYKVKVLDVIELDCRAIRGAVGNRMSNFSLAYLVCRWDLKSIPLEESS